MRPPDQIDPLPRSVATRFCEATHAAGSVALAAPSHYRHRKVRWLNCCGRKFSDASMSDRPDIPSYPRFTSSWPVGYESPDGSRSTFFFAFPVSSMSVALAVPSVASSEIVSAISPTAAENRPHDRSVSPLTTSPVAADDDDDDDLDDDDDEEEGFDDDDANTDDVDDGFNDGLDEDDDLDDFDDIDEDDFDDDFDDDFEEELNDDYEIEIDDEISDEFGLSTGKDEDEEDDVDLEDFEDFENV